MDTEQLEKQLPIWNRMMYMALGAAVALVAASPNDFSFVGIVNLLLLILTIPTGFFLLFSKRWKTLPTKQTANTIFGYLVASLLLLLIPSVLGAGLFYSTFVFCYLIFLIILYSRLYKKTSHSDEMFP